MSSVNIIFPHQLFEKNTLLKITKKSILLEEYLFFNQYNFHKQKIAFHRASMKYYADELIKKGADLQYITAQEKNSDIRQLVPALQKRGITKINCYRVTDNWLEKHLSESCLASNIEIHWAESPLFLNSVEELSSFFKPSKKKFFQTSFYKNQRVTRNILVDKLEKPIGGKWTFDAENRKKYPKGKLPPNINFPEQTKYHKEAEAYVRKNYSDNLGAINDEVYYPISRKASKSWFKQFLEFRFHEFGTYEDAIIDNQNILNHAVLTPMMNVGLLDPNYVLETSLDFAAKNNVPINSLEGFVRQIIGWREFIRGVYLVKGSQERTTNFWGFSKKIPASFYDGSTGIAPIDQTIKKVLKTGYCHHIERLMVLGNFMVLCEFDPNEVYRWFMELFIDAYDWVMVPNVYGMSQYADGGLMSTKPYISGSNYLMKMSNYKKGEWQETWDGLFWRFMHVHQGFFLKNPRLSMLVRTFQKMPEDKKQQHLTNASKFLSRL